MVEWTRKLGERIKDNKTCNIVLGILFPSLLVVFSFCKVNRGLDITDSAYSLSNFCNLNSLDGMWFYSTFYANLLGGFFTKLPGGSTMLGMNVYTSMIKCILGLVMYFFFEKEMRLGKMLSFAGVLVSLGLCWCPTTILYNYLTYLLFGIASLMLYCGLAHKSNKLLVFAGFVLGSNVFVRLPNVVEAGLIVVVWIYAVIRKDKFMTCLNQTLFCMAGYCAAFIPALIAIACTRGMGEYFNGIIELMGMTSEASDYSTAGMLLQLIRSYSYAAKSVIIFAAFSLIAVALYGVICRKSVIAAELSAVAIGLFLIGYYYKAMKLFSRNYTEYSSIYGISKLTVIVLIVFVFVKLFDKKVTSDIKLMMLIALAVAMITPIGSNNDVYSVFNNIYLLLLISLYLLKNCKPRFHSMTGCGVVLTMLLLAFGYQSVRFGARFVFRDGQNAEFTSYVYNNAVMKNMLTTADNAKRLSDVSAVWQDMGLESEPLLLYGDVSGMGYYLGSKMAISTAWPSLPSFSTQKFEEDMAELIVQGDLPTILISKAEYDKLVYNCNSVKQEILKEYIINNNYCVIYDNDVFLVMTSH